MIDGNRVLILQKPNIVEIARLYWHLWHVYGYPVFFELLTKSLEAKVYNVQYRCMSDVPILLLSWHGGCS